MKFNLFIAITLLGAAVSAFPALPNSLDSNVIDKRHLHEFIDANDLVPNEIVERDIKKGVTGPSKAQTNCGPHVCLSFNEERQFVSQTGQHAYQSPAAHEIRGPCPGLNAAANHGYLPRDGVASILETIVGMRQMFSMSPELSGFLAAYAVSLTGDIITGTWSIGGPQPFLDPTGLLSPPQGISWSHNKYEGDTSIGRKDAYINDGDAHSLSMDVFKHAYSRGQMDGSDRYTLHKFRIDSARNQFRSIRQNPFYFAPMFSTTLVAPAAYNFIINFMSNHSADEPAGWLNGQDFKTWFGVRGKFDRSKPDAGLRWLPGQERMPKNWYKRPIGQSYNAPDVFLDLGIGWAAFPDTFRFGGNTNGTNSYKGIDIATLTGGTFTNGNILENNNFACLLFQTQQQAVPDQLKGLLGSIARRMSLIQRFSRPIFGELGCPELANYDSSVFNDYPGRNYNPKGPATNF